MKMMPILVLLMAFVSQTYGCNDYTMFLEESDLCGDHYNQTINPLWAQYFADQDLDAFCSAAGLESYTLSVCGWTAFNNDGACNETVEQNLEDHLNFSTFAVREACADYCLVNQTEATTDVHTCLDTMNTTVNDLVDGFDQSTDFDVACSSLHDAIETGGTCLEDALHGHACPEELTDNLTTLFTAVEHFYNLTCDNEDFEINIIIQCDDVSMAFDNLAECIVPLGVVAEIGISVQEDEEELTCIQGVAVISSVLSCVSDIASTATCPDSVTDDLNALVTDSLDHFTDECGDYSGYLTTTETSGQSIISSSSVIITVAFMLLVSH